MKRFPLFLVATWLMALGAQPAAAHGGVVEEDDLCVIKVNYLRGHFKIYQTLVDGHQEYCEDIPGTGETVFVMEYEHSGLGEVPIDFRVIRNVTGNGIFTNLDDVEQIDDLESVTILRHEAATQPDVFTVVHNFEEQGEFVGIVTVQNPETGRIYTAVFPFEVGFAGIRLGRLRKQNISEAIRELFCFPHLLCQEKLLLHVLAQQADVARRRRPTIPRPAMRSVRWSRPPPRTCRWP